MSDPGAHASQPVLANPRTVRGSDLAGWNLRDYAGDVVVLLLSIASLLASSIFISENKYFWNDELYSWYLISDSSFSGMWAAFHDKINNTPPLYFVLGWLWARPFGASELSLRLFSSLGFIVALVVTWITLRRVYGFWPTCMGALVVFLTSGIVLEQNAEARMYGLFLALGALSVYQFIHLIGVRRLEFKHLAGVTVLHAAIVNTHLFGPFYSAAIFAAFVLVDVNRKALRKRLYAAFVISWATFLLYLPAFLVQSDAGNPRAWIPVPTVSDFLELVGLMSRSFADVRMITVLIGLLVLIYFMRGGSLRMRLVPGERHLLLVALALMAVPVVTFLISRTVKPIFWDRYLVPSVLSYAIGIAHLTSVYIPSSVSLVRGRQPGELARSRIHHMGLFSLIALLLLFLVNPLVYASKYRGKVLPGSMDNAFGYDHLPTVVQTSGAFLQRHHYSPVRERYYFILDEEAATSDSSGAFGIQEHKHMEAYRRTYPDGVGKNIVRSDVFLSMTDSFLVNDYAEFTAVCPSRVVGLVSASEWNRLHCPQWVEKRLLNNSEYEVTHLGNVLNRAILLVGRRPPAEDALASQATQ